MADWKDIVADNEAPLSDEQLLKYLDENLTGNDRTALESMSISSFEADAIEGLQKINNPQLVTNHVAQLKQRLHQQLRAKKRKEKKTIKEFKWTILSIIILLVVCIIGFALIKLHYR